MKLEKTKLGKLAKATIISSALFFNALGHAQEQKKDFRIQPIGLEEVKPEKEFGFGWGFNYVSWTTGDYPLTSAWKEQKYFNSQGIIKADITTNKPYRGKGSLELILQTEGSNENKRQGEFFVDLRYPPSYEASKPFVVNKDNLGVDLSGKTLAALVFCEKGTSGSANGVQLFAKSIKIENEKEVWGSYYGNWHNIFKDKSPDDPKTVSFKLSGYSEDGWMRYLDRDYKFDPKEIIIHPPKDVFVGCAIEDLWSLVSMVFPDSSPKESKEPFLAYIEKDFDPEHVAIIGLKYGLNKNYKNDVSGKLWVDDLGWMNIKKLYPAGIKDILDFGFMPNPQGVPLWDFLVANNEKGVYTEYTFEEVFEEGKGWVTKEIIEKKCNIKAFNKVIFPFEDTSDPIVSMKGHGFDIAALVQTEYMSAPDSVTIHPHGKKSHTDAELAEAIKYMKSNDLRVIIKPHVDVMDDSWRGDIRPRDKEKWFKSYTDFITHYAKIAEEHGAEMLVVGTEFKSLIGRDNRAEWENTIKEIRKVYSGMITYAANWDNYRDVDIWDLVDIAGIDAYFPISYMREPSLDNLIEGWFSIEYGGEERHWVRELSEFQEEVGKDILFTEVGYRSTDYAAREPAEYREQRPINEDLQANCYRAVKKVFENKSWFRGALFWNRTPKIDFDSEHDIGFPTQHKKADKVIY